MKTMLLLLALCPISSFAAQTIDCFQINKDGSKAKRGGTLSLVLDGESGSAKMEGFWKKGSPYGQELSVPHANFGRAVDGSEFTTVFFDDLDNGGLVEYQLQLEENVEGRAFAGVKGDLVIGFEDNSSEPAPSWGYAMSCSGKL